MSPRSASAWSSTAPWKEKASVTSPPASPSPFTSTVASSWPRKQTRPSSPNRTTSPVARRLAGLTKARQRAPSSRLISVAEIAGSCSPRPIRRPWRLAGNTLVSLTTMASPRRNRLGNSRTVRSSKSVPGRTTNSFAASRGETGRSAMRSSGSAKSNRSVRIKARLSTRWHTALRSKHDLVGKPVSTFPDHALQAGYRNLWRGNQRVGKRGHPRHENRHKRQGRRYPGQARHRRRHLAPAVYPGDRGDDPKRPGHLPRAAVELRRGIARRRSKRRRNDLFRARRVRGAG